MKVVEGEYPPPAPSILRLGSGQVRPSADPSMNSGHAQDRPSHRGRGAQSNAIQSADVPELYVFRFYKLSLFLSNRYGIIPPA
jgi:hypothetical protein